MLLTARDISKAHNRTLFTGVSLSIAEGDRLGLIGPNGAGKSTLLKILAGQETMDGGTITGAKGLRAVYVPQQDAFPEEMTARAIVTDAGVHGTGSRDHAATEPGGAAVAGHHLDHHEAEVLADMILARMGFDDAHADGAARTLSGGWRKRLAVARALASAGGEPDLLLLDEPTNHLDLEGIRWLESLVKPAGGDTGFASGFASIFVTHDRSFLESVATGIIELSNAYPEGTLSVKGNYTEFLRRKEEFLSGQARQEQAMAGRVRKDLAWLARGPQARRTKSKSRIGASYERIDELADLKARNTAAASGGARVDFNATERKTRKLIAAKGISKSLGGRALFSGVDLSLGVGDCLGLLGPNGSGKTTLIRVLTGELGPDTGVVERSDPEPRVVVFSQHRRDFAPTTLLRDALSPGSDRVDYRGQSLHITAWSRRFLFRDEQLEQPVKSLSGGELARIHIARIMLEPADVLVLDEPTNDLDIPTLETMEEALESFPGALVLVTHDRAMLERLATEILSLDGKGGAKMFASLDQAVAEETARARAEEKAAKKGSSSGSPTAEVTGSAAPARKKLSYNEQREYDAIEQKITEAEARAAKAEASLNDPAVIANHTKMAKACEALDEAKATVATLYARWEELEAKKK